MKKMKPFLLVLITAILIFIFTSPFLELFAKITGQGVYGGSWGLSGKAYEEGFFISSSFFVTLALMIFGSKKKYYALTIFLLFIFLIQISVPESLIVSAGAALVAWFLSQIILVIKKKFIK